MTGLTGWLSSLFLSPWGALLGLTLPAVVVLYLLKLKRSRREVASVLLWRQSLEDMTANSPFQKLKSNPLMLIQLLLMALLTLAMMRPTIHLESISGVDTFVLLDTSASMAAKDVEPSRLEVARSMIRDRIAGLGQADRMMIVTCSNRAEVSVPLTGDKGELYDGLNRVRVRETGTNFSEAVTLLKAAIGEESEKSRIHLYSDGAIPGSGDLFPPSVETVFVQVGEAGKNVGIGRLALNASPSDDDESRVFVEVTRDSDVTGTTSLTLEWNGNLLDAHEFQWGEDLAHTHVFQTPRLDSGLLSVKIDESDPLALDNLAAAYLRPVPPLRVALVANGETPVARVLGLMPKVEAVRIAPEAYSATMEAKVIVFEGWAPDVPPTNAAGCVFLGVEPPGEGNATWEEEIEFPVIMDWQRNHPVTRGADYRNLQVAKAIKVTLSDPADLLVESRDTVLMYRREFDERRWAITTFPLFESNWARLYSFPITLTNAIRWAAGRGRGLELARVFRTGEVLEVEAAPGRDVATVLAPSGVESDLDTSSGRTTYYSATLAAGPYEIASGEEEPDRVWFNLLDSAESRIAPAKEIAFGEEKIEAQTSPRPQTREIWTWIALAAFIVLMGEWWFYTRESWT